MKKLNVILTLALFLAGFVSVGSLKGQAWEDNQDYIRGLFSWDDLEEANFNKRKGFKDNFGGLKGEYEKLSDTAKDALGDAGVKIETIDKFKQKADEFEADNVGVNEESGDDVKEAFVKAYLDLEPRVRFLVILTDVQWNLILAKKQADEETEKANDFKTNIWDAFYGANKDIVDYLVGATEATEAT